MSPQQTIDRLLQMRLTKFQYGFVLDLQGHEPSPNQLRILKEILERNERYNPRPDWYGHVGK
jgi:hypothetical protein